MLYPSNTTPFSLDLETPPFRLFWGRRRNWRIRERREGGKGEQKGGGFDKHRATLLWLLSHKFQGMKGGGLEVGMR